MTECKDGLAKVCDRGCAVFQQVNNNVRRDNSAELIMMIQSSIFPGIKKCFVFCSVTHQLPHAHVVSK